MTESTLNVQREIERLAPVDPEAPVDGADIDGTVPWDRLIEALRKLGKQQLRLGQNVELLGDRNSDTLERLDELVALVGRQTSDEQAAAAEESRQMALKAVQIIDMLDDLALLAREAGDEQWPQNLERLQDKVMRILQDMGITPVPGEGETFDSEVHESLETVDRSDDQAPYEVVSVLQRGFRFRGTVLRPAQVITTRP